MVNERRLCCSDCRQQTEFSMCVAVWQWQCNGVCDLQNNLPKVYKDCHPKTSRRRLFGARRRLFYAEPSLKQLPP